MTMSKSLEVAKSTLERGNSAERVLSDASSGRFPLERKPKNLLVSDL